MLYLTEPHLICACATHANCGQGCEFLLYLYHLRAVSALLYAVCSVGNDNGPELQRMLSLLRGPLPTAAKTGAAALGNTAITSFLRPAASAEGGHIAAGQGGE